MAHAVKAFGQDARHFETQAELIEALGAEHDKNTTILIKGSRSAAMENVVAALCGTTPGETLMLLLLAEYLQQFYKGFAVFQYLTLRGILGVLTALSFSLCSGPVDDPHPAEPADRSIRA